MLSFNEYIVKNKKKLSLSSSISEVIDFLIEENLTHYPIIENGVFLGNISLNDAETLNQEDLLINCSSLLEVFFVRENGFWFEVLELFSKHQTNLIPVLNTENKCIGAYRFDDVISFFSETPFIKETGTTVIIQKNSFNYSISQISQIFEINNSKIFGIIITEIKDQTVQITIKATSINLNEIIQTLRRFEYDVISQHAEDHFLSDLKERSEYLDKYLNI